MRQAARARHARRRLGRRRSRAWPGGDRRARRPTCIRTRCTARWARRAPSRMCQADRATIWSSTQSAYPMRSTAAMILGLPPDNVRVIFTARLGLLRHQRRRHRVLRRRAAVAGRRPAGARAAVAAGRDGVGELRLRLRHRSAGGRWTPPARSSRGTARRGTRRSAAGPATTRPATSSPARCSGFSPAPFAPRAPAPPPTGVQQRQQRRAVVRDRLRGRTCGGTGIVKSERVLTHTIRSPFFTGPLRSPSRLQNTFAHESFMDEIAARVKADPGRVPPAPPARSAAHRRREGGREGGGVGHAAVAAAGPSARTGVAQRARDRVRALRGRQRLLRAGGRGRGRSGQRRASRVTRLVASQDCGPISIPDGMKNQIEGGALQGLSRALGEAVTWDATKVTSDRLADVPQPHARAPRCRRSRAC